MNFGMIMVRKRFSDFLKRPAFRMVILCALVFLSCATDTGRRYQEIDGRFGDTETLNYEYANKSVTDEVREAHYFVNIEIEDPAIASVTFPEIGDIHTVTPVTGSAIVQFTTDISGKVLSHRFVKRAGVGLDAYVEAMIGGIIVRPVMHRGEKGGSVFNVRFVFCERQP
jgi:hypothetical protein